MFGFHWPELIIVLVLATVIFGPKRLPEIGGSLGRGIRSFRQTVDGLDQESGVKDLKEAGKDANNPSKPAS